MRKLPNSVLVDIDGAALVAARAAKGLSQSGLAELAGVSRRSVGDYERGVHPARLDVAQALAGALGRPVAELTRGVARRSAAARPPEPTGPAAPWKNDKRAPRSALERGVDAERALPGDLPYVHQGKKLEPLGFRRLQAVYTAYKLREGERSFLEAVVDRDRGASLEEAAELGSEGGVAARFGVVRTIAGLELELTMHTARAEHTRALQDRNGRPVRLVVRVHVCKGPPVFQFFVGAGTLRPWTFVVDEVLA